MTTRKAIRTEPVILISQGSESTPNLSPNLSGVIRGAET